jgi:hypothetical protein
MVASTVLGVSTHAWTSNMLTSSELLRERSTHPFSVVVNVLNLTVKEFEGANEWPVIVILVATFSAAEVGLSFTSFGTLANSTLPPVCVYRCPSMAIVSQLSITA